MQPTDQSRRRGGLPAWAPYAGVVALITTLAALLALVAFDRERRSGQERALAAVQQAAQLLETDLAEQFARIDLALSAAAYYVRQLPAGNQAGPAALQQFLDEQRELVPEIDALYFLPAEGSHQPASVVAPEDIPAIAGLRATPRDQFAVAGPVADPTRHRWHLLFARRLDGDGGPGAGLVVARMATSRFDAVLARHDPGAHGSVTLRAFDTTLIARHPLPPWPRSGIGTRSVDIQRRYAGSPAGHYVGASPLDGVERLSAFRRLHSYPVYVSVGRSVAALSAELRQNALPLVALTALISLVAALSAWRLYRSSRRRDMAERSSQQSQKSLALALDATSDGIWNHDRRTGRLDCSPAYYSMLGYAPGDFADPGASLWTQLLHPDDSEEVAPRAEQLLQTQGSFDLEFRLRARDGSYKWILSRARVVEHDAQGQPLRVVGTHTDLTGHKRTEDQLHAAYAEQNAIFDAAAVGIVLLRERVVLRCNRRLEQIFGARHDELVGQSTRLWYPDESSFEAVGREVYPTVNRGETFRSERRMVRKDGTLFWARLTGRALRADDPAAGTLLIVEDITAECTAAAELEQAKELAESATRAKSNFLANMSHEIRTPMNAVVGMAHLALQTELNPRQRDYLRKIESASQHLLFIINDILDLSRIESGRLGVERGGFNLDALLDRVAKLLGEKAGSKGLEFVLDVAPTVPRNLVGDPLRLEQVLINLGTNAVKFTDTGEVVIAGRLLARDGGDVVLRFSVRDTGIGLSDEDLGRLFENFQQGDASRTRRYGGTGLGLAISKRLVELMGGEVGVTSSLGHGSNFWFTIRVGVGAEAPAALLPRPDLRGKRLLVVDDNDTAREVLRDMLASLTFVVTEVPSGEEAIAEVRRASAAARPYDVVFLDWRMPGLDGMETARRILELGLDPAPHLAMVTAHGSAELAVLAGESGIESVLSKPVSASTLFNDVMQLLGSRRGDLQRAPRATGDGQPSLVPLQGARVLLVEDNVLNQEVARDLLASAGMQVDVAGDGAQAVQMAQANRYDLVFMDMQMPVMDGLQATVAIRALPGCDALPIVAMTANTMRADEQLCLAAGMNDYVAKPIEPQRLWDTLHRWLVPGGAGAFAAAATDGGTVAARARAGLDVTAGLKRVAGNRKLYDSVLRLFVDNHRHEAEDLRRAVAEQDWTGAVRRAHTIKGLAGTIGASALQNLSRDLENALRVPEPLELLEPRMDAFAREVEGVAQAIEAWLQPDDGAPSAREAPPADPQQLAAACRELDACLARDDLKAREVFATHAGLLRGALGNEADGLGRALEHFDFVAARAALASSCAARGVELGSTPEPAG